MYGFVVAHLETDHLLALVRRAMDEIDDRPVDVTARRAARIASLLGETEFAVELGLELKLLGGHPPSNRETTIRLMADPTTWGQPDGPAEKALSVYVHNRRIDDDSNKDKIDNHGLGEDPGLAVDDRCRPRTPRERRPAGDAWSHGPHPGTGAAQGICGPLLVGAPAGVRERQRDIYERFRSRVDAALAVGAPEVLDQFTAVYRRLRDAAKDPNAPVSEELAQAVTTCRRILKAVADHLLPGVRKATTDEGNSLDDAAYRNRLYEFIKQNAASDTTGEAVRAAVGGAYERFTALDKMASKGVHAELGMYEGRVVRDRDLSGGRRTAVPSRSWRIGGYRLKVDGLTRGVRQAAALDPWSSMPDVAAIGPGHRGRVLGEHGRDVSAGHSVMSAHVGEVFEQVTGRGGDRFPRVTSAVPLSRPASRPVGESRPGSCRHGGNRRAP